MIGGHFASLEFALVLLQVGATLVLAMLAAVLAGRTAFALAQLRQRRNDRRYGGLVRRALDGDEAAVRALVASPTRHRVFLAVLLITPLIEDRDPSRIARTRVIAEALSLVPVADRFLRSLWWWRRALALRALGLTQVRDRTASIINALDDPHPDVRAAALDALTDLKDPASLQAIVVRLHDASLHRGRRAAALEAFGRECEPFLLDLAAVDPTHRVNYARALALCGSDQSRPTLCAWAGDANPQVRAAAFEALAHVGLDPGAARLAIDALDRDEPAVRVMAARSLGGWTGEGDAVPSLIRRLDDAWVVAVGAAESLRSIRPGGVAALTVCAERADLAGLLARQMLWEEQRNAD
jgi:hypothetical protein